MAIGTVHAGRRGVPGPAGTGTGVPNGGTTGQALVKLSGTNGDVGWADTSGVGVTDGDKGDVVVSSTGTVWTIDSGAVSNSKLASMAQATIKGRASGAGTGDPVDLTASQVRTILNVADGATANSSDASLRDRSTHTGTEPITALPASVPLFATLASGGTPLRPTNDSARLVIWVCESSGTLPPLVSSGTAGRYAIDVVTVKVP